MEGTASDPHGHPKYGKFSEYIKQYQSELHRVLNTHKEIETYNHIQGISPYLLRKVHGLTPLSVFIPKEYGGGGLTGLADFWVVTARKQKSDGKLIRDIDMFICDMNDKDQRIEVADFYLTVTTINLF